MKISTSSKTDGENMLIKASTYIVKLKKYKDMHMKLTNYVSTNKDKIKSPVWELKNNKFGF